MKSLAIGIGQTVLAMGILLISQSAYAQYGWCCMDVTHAGSTDAERCENNMITFAKSFECEAHKEKHDQEFGHDSTCSAGMGALPTVPAVAATDVEPATLDTMNGASDSSR
jgi:hypothetical protein